MSLIGTTMSWGDSVEVPTHSGHWDPTRPLERLRSAGAWFHRVLEVGWIHVAWTHIGGGRDRCARTA
jgi:hypothetical protein